MQSEHSAPKPLTIELASKPIVLNPEQIKRLIERAIQDGDVFSKAELEALSALWNDLTKSNEH